MSGRPIRVLVCDDEPGVRFALADALESSTDPRVDVSEAASAEEALARVDAADVLVTDLSMPGMGGLDLLREVRRREPGVPVVVVTARGSERIAVEAMRAGAHDYLTKPFDIDELRLAVARAFDASSLTRDARRAAAERATGRPLVGESPVMRALFERIERLARRDIPVLVRGETGTGKEIVASLLHALGPRATGPLVRFNCAAVPTELAEAELFGHAKGAFTGARGASAGYFARAHGGTLVLDEVGELPVPIQPKLLRALQDGEIQPLGTARPERVDVRVVACTLRDLREEARAGRFREDLFYRLAVVEIAVPPLRDRGGDVPLLARAFAARYAERFGLDGVHLTDALVAALEARSWPGNVRELENAIAGLVALSDGGPIDVGALTADAPVGDAPRVAPRAAGGAPTSLRAELEALEQRRITEALERSGGNRSEAARSLGMSRVTFLDRCKRLGLG